MARTIIIGLGSNCNPRRQLDLAAEMLEEAFGEIKLSEYMETEPLSGKGPRYLNAVASARTDMGPMEAKALLGEIERMLGRDRQNPLLVAIDLDLLALGGLVLPECRLPSKDLARRPFCLLPAASIEPGFIHPVTGLSLEEMALSMRRKARLT